MLKQIECMVCNKPAQIAIENLNGYVENEKFNIYYCSFCNTSFVWPQKVDNEIYNFIYSQTDIIPGYNRYALYAKKIKEKKKPLSYLASKEAMYYAVRGLLAQGNDKTIKILEVGSGLGYLTYAIEKEGYDILGLDISEDAVERARIRFGCNYVCEDVYQFARDYSGKFDLIILTEVIEHVPEMNNFFDILIGMLNDRGKIIISTPNKSAYPLAESWYTELPPVHLTWFSEESFMHIAGRRKLSYYFFDFTKFNRRHFDFTKYRYCGNYLRRRAIISTLNAEGKVLYPKSLINLNFIFKLKMYFRIFFKSIIERLLILSPLMNKKHLSRNNILCVIIQKNIVDKNAIVKHSMLA